MEIQKLNCPSCGAPISIPEDLDQLNCASCGSTLAVNRGEGYVALKIVEKVAQVLQQSGKETQSAIREGTEVTRKELQRMQITQDLSMTEMRLSSINSEIREVQRGVQNLMTKSQIHDLNIQSYYVLDKIRNLRAQLIGLDSDNPADKLEYTENELWFVQAEMRVLRSAAPLTPDMQQLLNSLGTKEKELLNLQQKQKIRGIKATLKSFQLGPVDDNKQEILSNRLEIIKKDLENLNAQARTPELDQVKNELGQMFKDIYDKWDRLEDIRIQNLLESKAIESLPHDIETLRVKYDKIQNDLKNLASMQPNPVIEKYYRNLQGQSREIYTQIKKLQKQAINEAKSATGVSLGTATGFSLGAILGSFAGIFNKRASGIGSASLVSSDRTDSPSPSALMQDFIQPLPPLLLSGKTLIKSLILAIIPIIIFFCASFSIYSSFPSSNKTSGSPVTSIPLFGIFFGYIIWSYLFFHTIAPGIRFIPPWPKASVSTERLLQRTSKPRIGFFAGIDILGGIAILLLCLLLTLPSEVTMIGCLIIVPVGLVLAFYIGRNVSKQIS
jgi:ribosomal protein S27AE